MNKNIIKFADDILKRNDGNNELLKKCLKNRKEFGLEINDVIYIISSYFKNEDPIEYFFRINNEEDIIKRNKEQIILPGSMTIGIEIETEGENSYFLKSLDGIIDDGWECKYDLSLNQDGIETTSRILLGNHKQSSYSIKKVCARLEILGRTVSRRCGGHVHIGADYLSSSQSWKNLIELFGNAEEVIYLISNEVGELPREGTLKYAKPISINFQKIISKGTVTLQTEEDLKNFAKMAQEGKSSLIRKRYGINYMNVGNEKNTIEFRISNEPKNANTWIRNINLNGGIIKAAEDLAVIHSKPENERTPQEKATLKCFERLKEKGISNNEKLEFLLYIAIPEENREVYRDRYRVNSLLLEQNPELKRRLKEKIAREPISLDELFKEDSEGMEI